ncbi:uncharacterized protein EI90DRAFT_3155807 [Cantharellus anzutake]|uniref:uncharacterized protein n=1 Tax=Cantharellus anzutake TaxID=1750568 RepID=UPI001903B245|nr:uncharacterized protein EI90DRAFT_3155807 [Cantharellus anzutake]KAF8328438.1 hypothetical protein EI90DRAFT_3155807 [Cantharellus anzutake]
MAGIDRDRISILSRRSIASAASRLSTLWSKIPLSSRKLSSPLADICSYIETTPDAQSSPINELVIYKEEKGVQHEFLLVRLAKPAGEEFWVRLERKRPVGALRNLISSALKANDIVSFSGKRATLMGSTKSVEKTRIIFRTAPSLRDLFRVLEALRESSKFYELWPENCYFFASVVAEHLYGLDESAELVGALRWLDLGAEARRRIHQIIASYDHHPAQAHGDESGGVSRPGSPAFQSFIDAFEAENMSASILAKLPYPVTTHRDSTESCLPGTRTGLIKHIMAWCRNIQASEKRVMLLTAVAGAGKTSIASSIAEECTKEGILLLSLFFRAGEQSRPDHLFSGMARSLATRDPVYHTFVVSTLQADPTLINAPFTRQFEKLVAEPLRMKVPSSDRPMVVIIDALDECDRHAFPRLVDVFWKEVPKLPSNIKFFVTSRLFDLVDRLLSPESPIDRLGISLSDDANVHDCAIYIRSQLHELKDAHPGLKHNLKEDDELVQAILERAGGLFIWISTVFRYVKTTGTSLEILGELLNASSNRPMTSAEEIMDNLYSNILEKCNWKDEDFVHDYQITMGAILIAQRPLSVEAWDAILSPLLKSSVVKDTLAELAPFVSGIGDPRIPVRFLHQSFPDFLMYRSSSQSPGLPRFTVDAKKENERVALRFVEILNNGLSSMRGLGLAKNLSKRAPIPQETLSEQFRYACRHIAYHLHQIQEPPEGLRKSVRTFLNQRVVQWVEVCVRTGEYISISSFPEWARLKADPSSVKVIRILAKALGKVWVNLGFPLRIHEAYELANDSVALCRCLASLDFGFHAPILVRSLWKRSIAPILARSLWKLSISLKNLEMYSEALPVIKESVELWRELYSDALPVIEESVKLWRELVAVRLTPSTSGLAESLLILNESLQNLGRHSEALPAIEECVKIWRELVAVHPTSYTPSLARSLHCLYWTLRSLRRHSETLPVIKETVKLWRKLATLHPTPHATRYLAYSLNNLSWSFRRLGHRSEAVPFIEESISLYRSILVTHPRLYATALRTLSSVLSSVGRYSDALAAGEESLSNYHQLHSEYPGAYEHGLRKAYSCIAVALEGLGRHDDAMAARTLMGNP